MLRQRIFGDVGRVVNSFVSVRHTDACAWQLRFRMSLYTQRVSRSALLAEIQGPVYLVSSKHICRKYSHVIRAPDLRRVISPLRVLSEQDRALLALGGLPKSWWPCNNIRRLLRQPHSVYLTNNFPDRDPLPWNPCRHYCCSKMAPKSVNPPQSLVNIWMTNK